MVDLEAQLFVEHASWLAKMLPDPTRRGLVVWLAGYVEEEAARRLRDRMPIVHPGHLLAEHAVIELLERDLLTPQKRKDRRSYPDRNVDWQATFLNSPGMRPHVFVSVDTLSKVNSACVAALIGLARTWAVALDAMGERELGLRARRLREACARYRQLPAVPFNAGAARVLARLDRRAQLSVKAILEVLGFWRRAFGEDRDRASLFALGKELRISDMSNANALLELTATLSIVRSASNIRIGERGPFWTPVEGSWCKRHGIELRAGDWRCAVSKGLLSTAGGHRIDDELNDSTRAMGLVAVGRQPDIVLKFWHEARPHQTLFALADAKRNATGTGEAYLRDAIDVAAAYALSYAVPLGLTIADGRVRGTMTPLVTLFCVQGVPRVMNSAGTSSEQAEAIRCAERLPLVIAFELAKHFAPDGDPWRSPVLEAWFARLSSQACSRLSRCGGVAIATRSGEASTPVWASGP